MRRRAFGWGGWWGVIAMGAGLGSATGAGAADGFRISGDRIIIDRSEDWGAWRRPSHATEIDPEGGFVRPLLVRKRIDAIPGMDQFTSLIGDQRALDKLAKDVNREGGAMPLNIRSQAASVAGVPIVHLKDNEKKGIKAGDPIEWFYYYGGIRYTPRNAESATNILDGDPSTYWEPTTLISEGEWLDLPQSKRGPKIFLAPDEGGELTRVDSLAWAAASAGRRQVEFHSHDLDEWYVDIELGRVLPVRFIVLRFADPEVGEPFRQFRILGTPSHRRDASLGLIARTNTPNEDHQVVTFEVGSGPAIPEVGSDAVVDFDSPGGYLQLSRLRIAVTDSRFDRFRRLASEEEYLSLPLEDRGSIEYHILNTAGTETRVAREVYDKVDDERKGSLFYYQRERPRLADIEVWTQGDNISLGVIDGGGSVALTGSRVAAPGFDGLHETQYLQLVWSSDPRYHDRGILNLDLGARFWLDFFRMVGWFNGVDEVVTWISDGSRDPNGNLRFTEIDRDPSGQGRNDLQISLSEPAPVRYIRTQIFSDAPGRAGGYNTGDRIREFQIYGEGYPSQVTLTSPIIELPSATFLGAISWEAEVPDPELVDAEIRTRTGDRLVDVTEYYGSGGEPKTEDEYNKLPTSFKGPIVPRRVPGGGWSSWSQRYLTPGQRVTSPSPRRYLQIQARLLSQTPDLAATLRSIEVELLPPAAASSLAEVWPSEATPGHMEVFELFVRPTFIEEDPDGEPSSRFDEVLVDADPIQEFELLHITIGADGDMEDGGTAQQFSEPASRTDPDTGAPTNWFEGDDGPFLALLDPSSGDTLKVLQGGLPGIPAPEPEEASRVLLRLPRRVDSLPAGDGDRLFYRKILEVDEEVPVDEDGRILKELTYLGLPVEQRGRILYFRITGHTDEGDPLQEAVEEFDYRALPDSTKGEVRYFRKLVGSGGEFPYDREGVRLTEAAYSQLPQAERGRVQAAGELVRIAFRAKVLLNGTTLDVAIRDSEGGSGWQRVDPGNATLLQPGDGLSIAVPISPQVVRGIEVEPRTFTPNGDGINDLTEVRFSVGNVNVARPVEVRIHDLSGRLVWREKRLTFGDQRFQWDGSDGSGNRVAPGLYLCRVVVDVDAAGASRKADQRLIAVAY